MSNTLNPTLQARNALTCTGLGTLASATYVQSAAYTPNTNKPVDVVVEGTFATTNTPAGNKQVLVFIQESLDGSVYRSGPTSGTTTTDEPNLKLLGAVPMNTSSVSQIATFNVLQALGYVPYSFKVVVKNDLGVALTTGTLYTAEIAGIVN